MPLELLLHRYTNRLHQNLLLQPLSLLLLLMMMKMKVGSVSCQYRSNLHAQVNRQVNQTLNTFKFLTDEEFAEEAKEEEVEAAQGQNTEPKKKTFQMKPLPQPKPPRKHIYMYIYSRLQLLAGSLYKQVHLFPSLQDLFQVLQE